MGWIFKGTFFATWNVYLVVDWSDASAPRSRRDRGGAADAEDGGQQHEAVEEAEDDDEKEHLRNGNCFNLCRALYLLIQIAKSLSSEQ